MTELAACPTTADLALGAGRDGGPLGGGVGVGGGVPLTCTPDHHATLEQHYRDRLAMFAATPPWGLDFSRRRPPSKLTR